MHPFPTICPTLSSPVKRYAPVKECADACRTGAATDIIFGLALGYKSCIIPTIVIALCIYTGNSLAGMYVDSDLDLNAEYEWMFLRYGPSLHRYGIAMTALGMLSTLATGE